MLDATEALDAAVLDAWRMRIVRAAAHLRWADPSPVTRSHAHGTLLAIAAPADQLLLATEINEWALCASLMEAYPNRWAGLEARLEASQVESANGAEAPRQPDHAPPPVMAEAAALARFEWLAVRESNPVARVLLDAAQTRGLPRVLDDSTLTLGAGSGSRSFRLDALPAASAVDWSGMHGVPTALVTGSNGKTTTVRLIAACARAQRRHTGYSCTDGVYVDEEPLETGDYSGPDGARRVMRDRRVETAVLETARGGILRRGIAVSRADVAVVTNVSSDHFGEYGIDDLDGLADVKLSVGAVVASDGLLILNADDERLRTKADGLAERFGHCPPLGWFATDADLPLLQAHRRRGGSTAGVREGRMIVNHAGRDHDLGPIAAMPLTVDGKAAYNVENLAAAGLAATVLGVPPETVATVFARFGSGPDDNPGRMMRFDVGGAVALLDYAHNADGLRGLLTVADRLRGGRGRLGLLLGQAGNRTDADIEELVRVAAAFRPHFVVVKENELQLRGRAPGEVPRLIQGTLRRLGFSEAAIPVRDGEAAAARCALDWLRPGDVLALPIHSSSARGAVLALLNERSSKPRPS